MDLLIDAPNNELFEEFRDGVCRAIHTVLNLPDSTEIKKFKANTAKDRYTSHIYILLTEGRDEISEEDKDSLRFEIAHETQVPLNNIGFNRECA